MLQIDTNQSENIKKVNSSEVENSEVDYYIPSMYELVGNPEEEHYADYIDLGDDYIVECTTFYRDSQNQWYKVEK